MRNQASVILIILLSLFANTAVAQTGIGFTYKPSKLFSLKRSGGGWAVVANPSIPIPLLGSFGVSLSYQISRGSVRDVRPTYDAERRPIRSIRAYVSDFVLIIREGGKDYVFTLEDTESIEIVTEGIVRTKISNRSALIDLSRGSVQTISLRGKTFSSAKEVNPPMPLVFEEIFDFNSSNLAVASIEDKNGDYKYGVINGKREVVIPFVYDNIMMTTEDGDAEDAYGCGRNDNCFINFGDYSGLLAVMRKDLWGYIDIRNNLVIDYMFDEAYNFDISGNAKVSQGGNWFLINNKGDFVDNSND